MTQPDNNKRNESEPSLKEIISPRRNDPFVTDYGTISDFYISSQIGPASDYIDWFQRIRASRESDILRFHINCTGGDLFTTIQFIQVLSETKATVVMCVEGSCMSAATLLFLMGDEFTVSDHSVFLFHNYSGGVVGKGAEIYHGVMHERKWTEKLLREAYENFLTEEEISQLLEDKDIWMDAQTVVTRLKEKGTKSDDTLVKPKKKTSKKKTTKRKTIKKKS
jgi:ATP-dependent protease ClpP protease subunit